MTEPTATPQRAPLWLIVLAVLGIAWNAFGVFQLASSLAQTEADLVMGGMTPEAAKLYYNLPGWMTLVFAIGTVGGLVGSVLLLIRNRWSTPTFAASLAGYLALFAGDHAYGIFDAIPGQLAVLTVVLVIAALLLALALFARRRGLA